MNITEVRITKEDRGQFKGYASILLDDAFVVHDLKIIEGARGIFIAMPSKKWTDRCTECLSKVAVTDNYCHHCGIQLPDLIVPLDGQGPGSKVYKDICHPINNQFRGQILEAILKAFAETPEPLPPDPLCPNRDS